VSQREPQTGPLHRHSRNRIELIAEEAPVGTVMVKSVRPRRHHPVGEMALSLSRNPTASLRRGCK
jgi:hypothetical protein